MRIFLRTFNNKINSKTGAPLPEGQYRGTSEWQLFESILCESLKELKHFTILTEEKGMFEEPFGEKQLGEKYIYNHRCKRDMPNGDLFYMQMHMRELFTIDTNGWGADHSGNRLFKPEEIDQDEATRFCIEKSKSLSECGVSKCEQPRETSPTPEVFILVPLQIPRDYTIKHHSPIQIIDWLSAIITWAETNHHHICIKMHPHNKSDTDLHNLVDIYSKDFKFIHKVEGNINELIKRSSGLFVINSGTGFESLVHGKPVCTFGECDYSQASIVSDIRRLDEARDYIQSYSSESKLRGYKFVWWYWHKHAYDVNATDTPSRLTEYLKGVL